MRRLRRLAEKLIIPAPGRQRKRPIVADHASAMGSVESIHVLGLVQDFVQSEVLL
jgi:hypothetical protein